MEEKIREWKNDFKTSKKMEELMRNAVFGKRCLEESKKSESIIMLDLRTEIMYREKYLEIFIDNIVGTSIAKSEKKYKMERINKHLEKILQEYTQMTNELDEIIFNRTRKG